MFAKKRMKLRFSSIIIFLTSIFLITKVFRAFNTDGGVGGIWNIIQICFIICGLILTVFNFKNILKNRVLFAMFIFTCYYFINSLLSLDSFSISSIFDLLTTFYAFSILIIFYKIGYNVDIDKRTLLYYTFYILAIIIIVALYLNNWIRYGSIADVYYLLCLLPLIFIYCKNKKILFPVIITLFCLLISGKRAGLIALILMLLVYYFFKGFQYSDVKKHIKRFLKLIIFVFVLFFVVNYVCDYFNLNIIDRLFKLAEDGGSGRDIRYFQVLDAISNTEATKFLFGHGYGSVISYFGWDDVHNDFLQLFFENGLLGCILFISVYYNLIMYGFKLFKNKKYIYTPEYFMNLVCALMLSMFSFYINYPTYITCGMLIFGFIMVDYDKKNCVSNIERNNFYGY